MTLKASLENLEYWPPEATILGAIFVEAPLLGVTHATPIESNGSRVPETLSRTCPTGHAPCVRRLSRSFAAAVPAWPAGSARDVERRADHEPGAVGHETPAGAEGAVPALHVRLPA